MFFFLAPPKALLSDINSELISAFAALRDHRKSVESLLKKHARHHSERYYYRIRESSPRSLYGKAARFIYLNRTCFNGIYRVNTNGEFNVPKGTKSAVLLDTDDFEAVSAALRRAVLKVSDFEPILDEAGPGDFVFVDPPYTVRHNNNGFIKYNEILFCWQDQIRLAKAVARARDRGARVLATNANHKEIRDLYLSRGFRADTVRRYSSISAASESRRQFDEILIDSVKDPAEGVWARQRR